MLTEETFIFEVKAKPPARSVLYEEHLKLTNKAHIAEFAGYFMPLWYSSISAEHAAVRQKAGIFDCTHMGILEVAGKNAEACLNVITTNDVAALQTGSAQYSYILDAAGNVLDDIIIYRREADKFMVVVNAANEPKIKAYLSALQQGKASTEGKQTKFAEIRDMRDVKSGPDCRVDIALQGPESVKVLNKIDPTVSKKAESLKSFTLFENKLAGIDCIISATGYTGAKTSFEIFVHPESAAKLWNLLIGAGAIPCGLGARDSLRVEAGLPLYGHELDGIFNISPFEAGYGWAVKLNKEFFIGKQAVEKIAKTWHGLPAREGTARMAVLPMKVARLELPGEKGIRPVRQNDGVIINGKCVGWVLSSAGAGNRQIAIVYAQKDKVVEGTSIGVYYLARNEGQKNKGKKENVKRGEQLEPDITGKVISRFEKF
jgi:glycine cleavage system T protein